MKTKLFLLFLSIFCCAYICKAQTNMQLCGVLSGNITQKQTSEMARADCNSINLVDDDGNAFTILSYTFAYFPAEKGVHAYFEMANVSEITPTIKNKIAEIKPGDKIFITNITYLDNGEKKFTDKKYSYDFTE